MQEALIVLPVCFWVINETKFRCFQTGRLCRPPAHPKIIVSNETGNCKHIWHIWSMTRAWVASEWWANDSALGKRHRSDCDDLDIWTCRRRQPTRDKSTKARLNCLKRGHRSFLGRKHCTAADLSALFLWSSVSLTTSLSSPTASRVFSVWETSWATLVTAG